MTFQWTAVAVFLYAEITLLVLLCLPVISPLRWQKIFMIPIWNIIRSYWNKAFLTIIVLLIVLFLDAVREVRKYSNMNISEKTTHATTGAFEHIQMRLFRSQRNLYISGFSLFLWFVLRRTISLISMLAKGMGAQEALEMQVESTSETARKYLEENERLQQQQQQCFKAQTKCGTEESSDEENKKLKQEVEKLKAELKKTSNALTKATNEMTTVKKQCESLKKEYDHLSKEHKKLQECTEETPDKKNL